MIESFSALISRPASSYNPSCLDCVASCQKYKEKILLMMKFVTSFAFAACSSAASTTMAFQSSPAFLAVQQQRTASNTALAGFDLSGNTWKPDSEKMGSTDTGDYFPGT